MERQSTTFILMKLLRESMTNVHFEASAQAQQRRFVNDQFQRSNKNIERSIESSWDHLSDLIASFYEICTSIQQAKTRAEHVRENLRECKNLLLLKRQDIRRLWQSASEQNASDRIYQNIHDLKHVPSRLEFYLSKNFYLHASLLLLKAKEFPELRLIGALSDIDEQIKEGRSTLDERLRSELIYLIFDRTSNEVLSSKSLSIPFSKSDPKSTSRVRENRLLRKQLDHDFEEGKLFFESQMLAIIPDKYLLVDIRNQTATIYFDVLLQSASILWIISDVIDFLQKQLPEQLYRIVSRTTQHVIDSNSLLSSNSNATMNNADSLRDLFEAIYEQFKMVGKNFEHVIDVLALIQRRQSPVQLRQQEYLASQSAHESHATEIQMEIPYLFSIEFVWETIQRIMSDILSEYVDYNNMTGMTSPNSMSKSVTADYSSQPLPFDFSEHLMKKPPSRPNTVPRLFEFSHSAQYSSMTSYLQEQNRFLVKQEASQAATSSAVYKQYVCRPHYRNITVVHDIIQKIIDDIDTHCRLHASKRTLDRTLNEFIRDHFIGRVIRDIRESAQLSFLPSSMTLTDRSRSVELISFMVQKQLQLRVPILQSTYLIFKSCEELAALVKCLPPYANDFCQAIVDLLFKHRESCYKLFVSIVEKGESPGISICSNEWVKDPDINRHLRTMPAFDTFVRAPKHQYLMATDESDNVQNVRFRQTKETETLLINFNHSDMNADDICNDYKHIQVLATIHESLDWLFCKLTPYFDTLDKSLTDTKHLDSLTQTIVTVGFSNRPIKRTSSHYDQLKLSRLNLEIFSNAMKTTLNLSYDILLVLFLEIRLHCFYYLSIFFRNAPYYSYVMDTGPDEHIMTLNRDLTRLQETLSSALDENKFSFLFQGLGFVLATILIDSLPRFSTISESGVAKMCRNIFTIEQTLTQVRTVGDGELMRAQQFYEFISSFKPEDILDVIKFHGQEYTEQDYLHLLQLQYRSLSLDDREAFSLSAYEQLVKNLYLKK